MAVSLHQLLKTMTEMGAPTSTSPPTRRPRSACDGKLRPLDLPPLTAVDTKQLAYSVLTDAQKHRFEENLELDFSFGIKGLARFRANVFMQRGAVAAVYRHDPLRDPRLQGAGPAPGRRHASATSRAAWCSSPAPRAPASRRRWPPCSTRSTASATSTSITIEDPIEYLHAHKKCVVNQRELHADTHSFTERPARRPSARTPTSSSSARCATWRRSSRRCASPRRAT